MPNLIDSNGLQTASLQELIDNLTNAFKAIYGADINTNSNTPDGQLINIFAQQIKDVEDLISQVFNTFDPDNAIGTVLDQRVAINGVQRQAGTFTVTDITLVNASSVNLYGQDQTAQDIYTVSDNSGNKFQLETTILGLAAGTHVLVFKALEPGAVFTIPNTIVNQDTIVLGVTSVNNPTPYTTLGLNEETDAALKLRRQKSVSLASQGYLAGLLAALENTVGVTYANVYENNGNVTDGDGTPAHTIWVIVAGTATDADIADDIYKKRNAGAGMRGGTSYVVTQPNGTPFVVKWDTVITQNFFIDFTATSINGINAPDIGAIRTQLPSLFTPGVNEEININTLATIVQQVDPNTLVTNAGFSLGITQILNLSGVAASGSFVINYNGNASAAINWNDSTPTIQTKIQAVTGLELTTVSGSIASQTLTFDLSAEPLVLALLTVSSNTLQTSAPAAITFAYDEGYTPTLSPSTKRQQLVTVSANIVITPLILNPTTSSVQSGNTETFTAIGGYGAYTFSLSVNNSGGSINPTSGLYTAGGVSSVTDTVLVTDTQGNTRTATVTVTP